MGPEAEADFTSFATARSRALARTAYLLTGDRQHAEDLLQTALIETARHWHRIHTAPEAYARRVLYTRNISRWRRRRVTETALAHHDRAVDPSDADLRLTLEQAMARLTPKQRTLLVLRYFEDLTEVQTAHVLGISPGTVKSSTRQALARLRALAPELADLVGSEA